MTTWMLNRVADYWDQQVGAIYTHAQRLERLSSSDRQNALAEIAAAVARHAEALNDEWLAQAAFVMADDLYKAVCALTKWGNSYWDDSIAEYLQASAGTFCDALAKRGFLLRYVIDNAYEASDVGLTGPVDWFPVWLEAAGLCYICPQQVAFRLMEVDGCQPSAGRLPQFIAEGRDVGLQIVRRCLAGRNHYLFLDTDVTDDSLAPALAEPTSPGVILVFRKDPPVPGSRCAVKITPPHGPGRG
jgi:hypothetical protein